MTDIISAIRAINSNAEVSINAEDFDQITWHNGTEVISKSDIETKQKELQVKFDAQAYARNRALEYPPMEDQQDMQFHDAIDGTTTWQDAIQAVKNKYPKSG